MSGKNTRQGSREPLWKRKSCNNWHLENFSLKGLEFIRKIGIHICEGEKILEELVFMETYSIIKVISKKCLSNGRIKALLLGWEFDDNLFTLRFDWMTRQEYDDLVDFLRETAASPSK